MGSSLDSFGSSWVPEVHSLGLLGPLWAPFGAHLGARVDQLRSPGPHGSRFRPQLSQLRSRCPSDSPNLCNLGSKFVQFVQFGVQNGALCTQKVYFRKETHTFSSANLSPCTKLSHAYRFQAMIYTLLHALKSVLLDGLAGSRRVYNMNIYVHIWPEIWAYIATYEPWKQIRY